MANSDKDILITPNTGTENKPAIRFNGANNNPVNMYVEDTGALSIEGSAGQLLSITDSFSGTLFAVNDSYGIPSIDISDNGTVRLAPFSGKVGIGKTPTYTLDVAGYINSNGYYMNGQSVGGSFIISSGSIPTAVTAFAILNIPQTFKNLRLVLRNMYSTSNGSQFYVRFNQNANGSTHYNYYWNYGNNNNYNYNDTAYYVAGSTWSSTNYGITTVDFDDYANGSTYKKAVSSSFHTSTSGEAYAVGWQNVGWYRSQASITSLGIHASSGNFAGGTYILYGVR